MTKLLLLGAAALLSASAPTLGSAEQIEAQGGDGPFTCLFQNVSAEDRRSAAVAIEREAPATPLVAIVAIQAALPGCAEAAGWTEMQREMALCYVGVQLTREGMRHTYATRGVDLSELDSAAEAAAVRPPGTSPPSGNVLVAGLQRQGMTEEESFDMVMRHAFVAGMAEGLKRSFADPSFQGC